MAYATFTKDPAAVLDYKINWAAVLGDDTIVVSGWVFQPGIDTLDPSFDTTSTRVWVGAGQLDASYLAINTIETAQGRVFIKSLSFKMEKE